MIKTYNKVQEDINPPNNKRSDNMKLADKEFKLNDIVELGFINKNNESPYSKSK